MILKNKATEEEFFYDGSAPYGRLEVSYYQCTECENRAATPSGMACMAIDHRRYVKMVGEIDFSEVQFETIEDL